MKTRRRSQRGGLYHENNMRKLLRIYGNLHKSNEVKRYDKYEFFDNYGCMQLYYNNAWWEELYRGAVGGAALGAGEAVGGAGAPAAVSSTINMICLSASLAAGDKDSLVIERAKPGLNFVLLCSVGRSIDKWNKHAEKGNKNGYYYLGFDENVHILDNVIVLREEGIKEFDDKAERITQDHYDILLRRILNPNEVIRNNIHKNIKVAYLTRQNIIDKIKTLVAEIKQQKKITPETLSELEKQIQIKRSSIGAIKNEREKASEQETLTELRNEYEAKKQLDAKIPKEVCLFGFADATIIPLEYAGPPKSGISEENFKKLELNTRRPTFGNPDFDKYIKNLNNEVEAAKATSNKAAANAAERRARKAAAEAAEEAEAQRQFNLEQEKAKDEALAKRKSDLTGAIKEYLKNFQEYSIKKEEDIDIEINNHKKQAEEIVKELKGEDLERWITANDYNSYENYLFCKIIELMLKQYTDFCPWVEVEPNYVEEEGEEGEYNGEGGKRKTRRRSTRRRSTRRRSTRRCR